MHDIEHHYSHLDYTKSLDEMDPGETRIYREHPNKGANRVKDLQHFDEEVMRIILEHEEYADGSGFPRGLYQNQMSAPVMIAATANTFDRYMTFRNLPPKAALKEILINNMAQHPLEYMKALQDVLKEKGIL